MICEQSPDSSLEFGEKSSFFRIDQWRSGSGTVGKGRTLGNAVQISRFLGAKSGNTSMKRKFTESVAHDGSSKVLKVGDDKRTRIVRERESEKG